MMNQIQPGSDLHEIEYIYQALKYEMNSDSLYHAAYNLFLVGT